MRVALAAQRGAGRRRAEVAAASTSCEHVFVSREAAILHADLDAFYASVEQRDDPALRARPVVVGGGVVLAASYEARAHGVRSAMGGTQARRLCPHVAVVEPRWEAYVDASRAVFALLEEAAPNVEKLSIDEAFLDVSGLGRISGTPREIADRLRRDVRRVVGLPITVGVASTRALAKVASNVAKPDGLLVVPVGGELAFLHPLAVEQLWGVGPVTARRLRAREIATVGQLAALPQTTLVSILGRASGRHLHALAHNRDPRRVRSGRRRRSIGAQSALGRRSRSPQALDAVLVTLVERVTRRMRASGRIGRTIILRLRFADFSRATRSHTLPHPTAATRTILTTERTLLKAAAPMIERHGLTLIGVTVTNLDGDSRDLQLTMPLDDPAAGTLDTVIDEVRDRFGTSAVTRAALLGADERHAPRLPPPAAG